MAIIELYNTKQILPLAYRLDQAEAALRYLTAPWYMRRWSDCKRMGGNLIEWLASKGIRFYTLESSEEATDGTVPEEAGSD